MHRLALRPLMEFESSNPSDEARNYTLPGAGGVVGFISPVSEPYCGTCNRMRLTADGKFHLCLLNDDEMDVRKAIRSGGGMEAVARILVRAVELKPTGHHAGGPVHARALDVPNRRLSNLRRHVFDPTLTPDGRRVFPQYSFRTEDSVVIDACRCATF